MLADLFEHFSATRVTYRKALHGVAITEWLLEYKPEGLQEIANRLKQALTNH